MRHWGIWVKPDDRWYSAHGIVFSTTSLAVAKAQVELMFREGWPKDYIEIREFLES